MTHPFLPIDKKSCLVASTCSYRGLSLLVGKCSILVPEQKIFNRRWACIAIQAEMYVYHSLQMSYLVISALCVFCTNCQAQEFPYVSFNGATYANHSYLDLTLVGNMDSNKVLCRTSFQDCCSGPQGPYRGDWYFPNGSRLPFPDHGMNAIAEQRAAQRVELVRINNCLECIAAT